MEGCCLLDAGSSESKSLAEARRRRGVDGGLVSRKDARAQRKSQRRWELAFSYQPSAFCQRKGSVFTQGAMGRPSPAAARTAQAFTCYIQMAAGRRLTWAIIEGFADCAEMRLKLARAPHTTDIGFNSMNRDAQFDAEAAAVVAGLGAGPRIAVIGSTSFWGADSEALTVAIAAELAQIAGLVAVTGGMEGVGMTFGRAFAAARRELGRPEEVFHVLPRRTRECDHGVTLHAGDGFYERREILGRVAKVYLVIEGGPGTAHEAAVADAHGATVIPVGRTGGVAGELFEGRERPAGATAGDWSLLGEMGTPHAAAAEAASRLLRKALGGL